MDCEPLLSHFMILKPCYWKEHSSVVFKLFASFWSASKIRDKQWLVYGLVVLC